MLARRLTTILPEMTLAEAIETTRIHRGAGETGAHTVFVTTSRVAPPGTPLSACSLKAGGDPVHCPVQLWHTGGHGSPGDLARPAVTRSGAAGVARMVTNTVRSLARGVASAVPPFRSLRPRWDGGGPVERVYVRVGAGTFYAELSGVGPPLILVHGLGGSTRWWARNVPALARSCRVHVIDLLGFGRSRGQCFVLREAAGLLVGMMDRLGLARASVVGHSMGGWIAAYAAAHFPERVERLVLVDAAALPLERLSLRQAWRMVRGLPRLPLTLLPVLGTDALRAGPVTVIRALRELLGMDIRRELARIEAPTLILWGEHDATLPVAVGQRLHAHLPQAAFRVIAGAGHCPMWDRPTAVNQAVIEFLGRGHAPTPV